MKERDPLQYPYRQIIDTWIAYVDVAVRCWSGLFDVTAFTCLIAQGIGGTRQGAAHTRSCHFLNLQCELASRRE